MKNSSGHELREGQLVRCTSLSKVVMLARIIAFTKLGARVLYYPPGTVEPKELHDRSTSDDGTMAEWAIDNLTPLTEKAGEFKSLDVEL